MKYKYLANISLLLVILSSCGSDNKSDTETIINENNNKILSERKEKALFGYRCTILSHELLKVMDSQGQITQYDAASTTSPEVHPKASDRTGASMYLAWAWGVRNYGKKLVIDNDPNFDVNDSEYINQLDSVKKMIVNREPWVTNDFINCRDAWLNDENGIDLST